jgi:hypothetical protein
MLLLLLFSQVKFHSPASPGAARATAAIVFMGCTHIGMRKPSPEATLYSPVNSRVVPRSRPIVAANATTCKGTTKTLK